MVLHNVKNYDIYLIMQELDKFNVGLDYLFGRQSQHYCFEAQTLASSSSIKLAKKLDRLRKGLINIQNISDNEWFKWCLVRYLYPTDDNPRRIRKVEKLHGNKLNFKDIENSKNVLKINMLIYY